MAIIKKIFMLLWLSTLTYIASDFHQHHAVYAEGDWLQKCGLCHCKWNSGKKMADCKNTSLNVIPTEMSTEMQVIDLSSNQIAELGREEFAEANLENLHKIFMKNCTLQEINREALKGLQVLIELDCSNNQLRVLHPGTFTGLIKLRTLIFNNNEIEVLEDFLFENLTFLFKIELKNNRLLHVGLQTFVNTGSVQNIFFDSNRLSVLKEDTFRNLFKLKSLSLAENPWNCTCDLQQFQKFVLNNNLYTPPTSCYEPLHLRGKLWSDVPTDNFACKPRIIQPRPGTSVDASTENVTLTCRIRGSPKPDIVWMFNKRPLNTNNDQHILIKSSQEINRINAVDTYISDLIIVGVKNSDKGSYVCSATNKGGKDEVEIMLVIPAPPVNKGAVVTTSSNTMLIICLIAIILLSILIIIGLVLCCYCRRVKKYSKNGSISENGLVSGKLDKTHPNGDSMLEGSVIMEMQKSLLTEVNPVEKPPRRAELDSTGDLIEDGHELKKTLLDETTFDYYIAGQQDDETQSISLSDTTARSRTTFIDDGYGTNLPPDLLAFPSRFPQSPSLQSSISNIQDGHLYAKSPMASPIYQHNPNLYQGPNSGFRTLQLPKGRNMSIINRSQSPFTPAPIIYPVVMKQGYVTIPRKPRTPSWTPSLSSNLTDFPPTSPTSQMSPDLVEPVYDNLGLRTTASGNSVLNLNKLGAASAAAAAAAAANIYSMKDRPLPATPRGYEAIPESMQQQQQQQQHHLQQAAAQQHYQQAVQQPQMAQPLSLTSLMDHSCMGNDDTEALYSRSSKQPTIGNASTIEKVAKVPPRPPPKPKKKVANGGVTANGGSSSKLFEDECEDGTEV